MLGFVTISWSSAEADTMRGGDDGSEVFAHCRIGPENVDSCGLVAERLGDFPWRYKTHAIVSHPLAISISALKIGTRFWSRVHPAVWRC